MLLSLHSKEPTRILSFEAPRGMIDERNVQSESIHSEKDEKNCPYLQSKGKESIHLCMNSLELMYAVRLLIPSFPRFDVYKDKEFFVVESIESNVCDMKVFPYCP